MMSVMFVFVVNTMTMMQLVVEHKYCDPILILELHNAGVEKFESDHAVRSGCNKMQGSAQEVVP